MSRTLDNGDEGRVGEAPHWRLVCLPGLTMTRTAHRFSYLRSNPLGLIPPPIGTLHLSVT